MTEAALETLITLSLSDENVSSPETAFTDCVGLEARTWTAKASPTEYDPEAGERYIDWAWT